VSRPCWRKKTGSQWDAFATPTSSKRCTV
jgi:hypothetical protein